MSGSGRRGLRYGEGADPPDLTTGLVMLGGIVSSAVLTFFIVPAAFWLFERQRHGNNGDPT